MFMTRSLHQDCIIPLVGRDIARSKPRTAFVPTTMFHACLSLMSGFCKLTRKLAQTQALAALSSPHPIWGAVFGADGVSAPFASETAVVHVDYDVADPPPKPSGDWTRFVCVSDTHARTFAVPDGDVLLHSGDLTESGTLAEMRTTVEWLASMPHRAKMFVRLISVGLNANPLMGYTGPCPSQNHRGESRSHSGRP